MESMERNELMQKSEQIASFNFGTTQHPGEVLETALQDRDEWMYIATGTYDINQLHITLLP